MTRQRPQRPISDADPRLPARSKHGASATALRLLLRAQDGRCAVCRADITAIGAAVVDHDHALAAQHGHPVARGCDRCRRQLLCNACNVALGMTRDDPNRLRLLAAYVEHWMTALRGAR